MRLVVVIRGLLRSSRSNGSSLYPVLGTQGLVALSSGYLSACMDQPHLGSFHSIVFVTVFGCSLDYYSSFHSFIHLLFHAAHVIILFVSRLTHPRSFIWFPITVQTGSVRRAYMYKYLIHFCSSSSGLSIVFRSLPFPLQPTLSALSKDTSA